jgi:hypothetical protein
MQQPGRTRKIVNLRGQSKSTKILGSFQSQSKSRCNKFISGLKDNRRSWKLHFRFYCTSEINFRFLVWTTQKRVVKFPGPTHGKPHSHYKVCSRGLRRGLSAKTIYLYEIVNIWTTTTIYLVARHLLIIRGLPILLTTTGRSLMVRDRFCRRSANAKSLGSFHRSNKRTKAK